MHMALMVLLSEQQGVMLATLSLSSRVGGFLIKARRAQGRACRFNGCHFVQAHFLSLLQKSFADN